MLNESMRLRMRMVSFILFHVVTYLKQDTNKYGGVGLCIFHHVGSCALDDDVGGGS